MIASRSAHFLGTALILSALESASTRPKILQEQNLGYYRSLFNGTHVGFETLLSLMGYYEGHEVKEGLDTDSLIIDTADEEDQTEIKIVGLDLGRTGTTSGVAALEILGYAVVHDDEQLKLTVPQKVGHRLTRTNSTKSWDFGVTTLLSKRQATIG